MANIDGQWRVDYTDEDGFIFGFDHLSDDGVETFVTTMCPHSALDFADAIIRIAGEEGYER